MIANWSGPGGMRFTTIVTAPIGEHRHYNTTAAVRKSYVYFYLFDVCLVVYLTFATISSGGSGGLIGP